MRYLLILILSFSFILSSFGQSLPDSGFTNKAEAKNLTLNGLMEGKWVESHGHDMNMVENDSTPCYESYSLTIYKVGKPLGIQREYSKCSGKLMLVVPFLNGKANGLSKGYFENGELSFECTYLDGKPNGVTKWYYINGNIQIEIPYNNNGKANGLKKEYYNNGKLKTETVYIDGVEGATKDYGENGNEIK